MAKRKKLKKSVKIILALTTILVVAGIVSFKVYQEYKYRQTYEYKLLQINYSLDETKTLTLKLSNAQLDEILVKEQNSNIVNFIKEKYFIYGNLERYLAYLDKNKNLGLSDIVALVNVKRDREFYEAPEEADINQGNLMIVNKYHNLTEEYIGPNLVKTSASYSYANNSLNEEAYTAFKELADEAKLAGYTIVIVSSYRDFKYQQEMWDDYKASFGTKKADAYVARAGHSEHQTGYAVDVGDFYDTNDKFGDTEAFTWMMTNCQKYGFILRYPEDKENITGYAYEPWHYRYVGKEMARKISAENITFDEYYEFYLAN